MRLIIQRVKNSSVKIDGKIVGKINQGLNVLVGFTVGDNLSIINSMINKILNLRIFEDNNKKMNLSILDIKGEVLLISQFTLYADTSSGRRPSFSKALNAKLANELFENFKTELSKQIIVKSGVFGADMEVEIVNDGPVTIIIDSTDK